MTAREFVASVLLIASVMGVLALVEVAAPLFARDARSEQRGRANVGLTALTFFLNWGLASAAAFLAAANAVEARGWLASSDLPLPVAIALTIVTLDLATYLAHRSMHVLPLLWRVHRVHHSDPFLDVTTTFRQHPAEGLWRFLWIVLPVWTLGLPVAGVVAYRLSSAVQAVLEHANIRLWPRLDRVLSLFWVTPNMHKLHHSRAQVETDSNYGNLFAVFDRAFHTFTPTDRAAGVVYGLDDVDPARTRSLAGLLTMPFSQDRKPLSMKMIPVGAGDD